MPATANPFAAAALATLVCVPAAAQPPITALPAEALAWEETPEGVAFAPLLGDRFDGAYMAMVRLPAGTISPPHVKSAGMFGVMVDGVMTHVAIDDLSEPEALGPGAFYTVPEGVPHVSRCISSTDCVTVLYQDGAFDFLPVEP